MGSSEKSSGIQGVSDGVEGYEGGSIIFCLSAQICCLGEAGLENGENQGYNTYVETSMSLRGEISKRLCGQVDYYQFQLGQIQTGKPRKFPGKGGFAMLR